VGIEPLMGLSFYFFGSLRSVLSMSAWPDRASSCSVLLYEKNSLRSPGLKPLFHFGGSIQGPKGSCSYPFSCLKRRLVQGLSSSLHGAKAALRYTRRSTLHKI